MNKKTFKINKTILLLTSSVFIMSQSIFAGELSPRVNLLQISKHKSEETVRIHASTDIDGCYWLEIDSTDKVMISMALSAYATGLPVRIQLETGNCVISRFVNEK